MPDNKFDKFLILFTCLLCSSNGSTVYRGGAKARAGAGE